MAKGPHGGRLLKDDHFSLEVSIVEDGVPPRFRVYCFEEGKPVNPKEVNLSIELKRLGNRITRFKFVPVAEFLHSDTVVKEPHSFNVTVLAEHHGKTHHWEYSQVEARVGISPDVAKTVGIRVETAGPTKIRSVLNLPGEVALNADRVCHVVPLISGLIAESRKNLGDVVREGEVIAVLDSRELADAKSSYLVHLKREELARINFDRIRNLWERKVSPEKEFLDARKAFEEEKIERLAAVQKLRALGLSKDDLENLRKNPDGPMTRYELRAPFDGVVIEKHMSKGEWVDDKADILCVADLATVWVDITVYANDLDAVRLGQHVTVKSDSTDLQASGKVSYVGPLVGEESRTAKARVVIDNRKGRWRPGMFVSVQLIREEKQVPVAVKAEAIQTLDRFGPSVFVRHGNQFEARPVELGRTDSRHVEVLKGLASGEQYASAKSFILKSELGKAGISHAH
jgi:cobalt-zinc-cadmium efflux system membrane fusion protein